MADGLTLRDLQDIKDDAHKAVTRQFRDAAEDNGWEPTPTPQDGANAEATGTTESDLDHVTGTSDSQDDPAAKPKKASKPKSEAPKGDTPDGDNNDKETK